MTQSITVSEILTELSSIDLGGFAPAVNVATKTQQYTQLLDQGQITAAECQDLIDDLNVQEMVAETADEMKIKEDVAAVLTKLTSELSSHVL